MNELELLRVIEYLERVRTPYRALFPMADDDPVWNILAHLVKSHLRGDLVTISALAAVANVPYATALRRIKTMIAEGQISRRPRGPKTFSLHPSERTLDAFLSYAQHIKSLLAQVMGVRPAGEKADDYYFGGSRVGAQSQPQSPSRRRGEGGRLRFLLHDDNYFASLQNLWADFRANRGSRRDFDLYPLPDLYRRASENAAQPISDYDVIVLNVPWLGEFVEAGGIRRAEPFLYYSGIDSLDFDPRVWATGRWKGRQEAVPAFSSIELLAVRSDLLDEAGLAYPKTFADVIKVGRALHAPRRGFFGVAWNAQRGMPLASSFAFHIACCGGAVLQMPRGRSDWSIGDIDPREITVGIDSEPGRQALDHMREMLAISPPGVLDLDWNSSLEIFMAGHAAMAHCWSMRAARFEYDVRSRVKRRVRYLPHPAGPRGANVTALGGFLLVVPSNLPESRVEAAFEAIRWMTSREAIQTHIKTGFPVLPRFSISADPEIAAGSPIVHAVNELARRDLLHTWQRAPLPQYAKIEAVIGEEIHAALRGDKTMDAGLRDAQYAIEKILQTARDGASLRG